MTTLSWSEARRRAIDLFNGELPKAETEATLIEAFEHAPTAVLRALEQVADDHRQGKVRSGWAVWAKRAQAAQSRSEITVEVGQDRERRIQNAERWLHNAGIHFDRWQDVQDELFTVPTGRERGHLHEWADDTLLRERMRKLWQDLRPRGEQAEREELERAEAWKANRQRVLEAMRNQRERLTAAQTQDDRKKGAA